MIVVEISSHIKYVLLIYDTLGQKSFLNTNHIINVINMINIVIQEEMFNFKYT